MVHTMHFHFGRVRAIVHAFHTLHIAHIHRAHIHHSRLVEFAGFDLVIGHAHAARGGEGKDLFEADIPHDVIEVRFRHIRSRVAFTRTYPGRRVARAVVGSGSEFISPESGDLNEYIISFGDTNEKAVLLDWFYVLAVCGDDGHRTTGEFKMEIGGG